MVDHRGGADDEVGVLFIDVGGGGEQRHRLVGFSESHLVAEEPRESVVIEEPKPADAGLLIRAEVALQAGEIDRLEGLEEFEIVHHFTALGFGGLFQLFEHGQTDPFEGGEAHFFAAGKPARFREIFQPVEPGLVEQDQPRVGKDHLLFLIQRAPNLGGIDLAQFRLIFEADDPPVIFGLLDLFDR